MSYLLFALLIVPAHPSAPIAAGGTESGLLYHCDFEANHDLNYDHWPDGWRRRLGRGFPYYIRGKTQPDPTRAGNRCLRFDLDGGGAAAYSPAVEASANHSYWVEALVKTAGLQHDRACITLRLLDAKRRPVTVHESRQLGGTTDWTPLRLGPITTDDPRVRFAAVGLQLLPGEAADLKGSASFDEVRLLRRPRLKFSTNRPLNLFGEADDVEITCRASGLNDRDAKLRLEVLDWRVGRPSRPTRRPLLSAETADLQVHWNPKLPGVGYYRVRASLLADGRELAQSETALVVLATQPRHAIGQFGWTLPRGEGSFPLPRLTELLTKVGIHQVKFPLWHDPADATRRQELVRFLDSLAWRDVRAIGLLHAPPVDVRKRLFGDEPPRSAASLFSAPPDQLGSELQAILLPMALHVHDWQLGEDRDHSFAGDRLAGEKIAALRAELGRSGLQARLAVPWDRQPPPAEPNRSWQATSHFVDSSHSPRELQNVVESIRALRPSREAYGPHWLTIETLPADHHDAARRAADLVHRMVAASAGGADAVFLHDPLDPRRGIVRADGTPGELLLPWRTAAWQLAGARYRGSLRLPGGSENRVFERAGQWTLVAWNRASREETLVLGDDARQVSVWGNVRPLPRRDHQQVVEVGALPTFVNGLDPAVTQSRLTASLTPERLPSEPGAAQRIQLRLRNFFGQQAAGAVRLAVPKKWRAQPSDPVRFEMPSGGEATVAWQVRLPYDIETGRHMLRADVTLFAGRQYRFSLYRDVTVGWKDIELDVSTRLDAAGNLVVEQQLQNLGQSSVGFDCELFIPHRRRQRVTLRGLSPGVHHHVYLIPNGQALLGKTLWLRAAQPGSRRVLSRKFEAAPQRASIAGNSGDI